MAAVFISHQAVDDLKNIFTALITWEKGPLELEHALQYVDDIEAKCFSLANKTYHFRTTYSTHKIYGDKVLTYRRSRTTVWYIIYTIDRFQRILITKIISNYLTIEK
jgi:plasmid stabilization system protein ParE